MCVSSLFKCLWWCAWSALSFITSKCAGESSVCNNDSILSSREGDIRRLFAPLYKLAAHVFENHLYFIWQTVHNKPYAEFRVFNFCFDRVDISHPVGLNFDTFEFFRQFDEPGIRACTWTLLCPSPLAFGRPFLCSSPRRTVTVFKFSIFRFLSCFFLICCF